MFNIQGKKCKFNVGAKKVKKMYLGNNQVYSAGNIVTYNVDLPENIVYTEEIDSDASCLYPITFTPSKKLWSFIGWKDDTYASDNILAEKIMHDDPITLYAVFKQDVTVSYNGNGADSGSVAKQIGTRYYNASGNTKDASFILEENKYTRNLYKWIAWAKGSVDGERYASGSSVSLDSNTTFYAVWEKIPIPYYAIQSGAIVNCPNAVAEQQGGHSNRSGEIVINDVSLYGSYGHTENSNGEYWGAYTGDLSTEGCSKLSFTLATYETNSSPEIRDYWVYGDGVQIDHGTISSISTYEVCTHTRTVDVSNYSTVAVRVRMQDNNYTDAWMGAGFIEVRLHD